jgi:hypothetical protein
MHVRDERLPVRAHGVSSGVQSALNEVWIVVCLLGSCTCHVVLTAQKVMDQRGRPVMAAQPRGLPAMAVQSAVAQFWEILHVITQYSQIPGAWRQLLPIAAAGHPFPAFSKCCSSVACE